MPFISINKSCNGVFTLLFIVKKNQMRRIVLRSSEGTEEGPETFEVFVEPAKQHTLDHMKSKYDAFTHSLFPRIVMIVFGQLS